MTRSFLAPLIASVLLLSSCATYSEMQANEPLLEVSSNKAPHDFAGCVMPKAREIWRSMVSIGPDGDSQVIVVQSDIGVIATTTISPQSGGSKIVYRARWKAGHFGDEWPAALRACQ